LLREIVRWQVEKTNAACAKILQDCLQRSDAAETKLSRAQLDRGKKEDFFNKVNEVTTTLTLVKEDRNDELNTIRSENVKLKCKVFKRNSKPNIVKEIMPEALIRSEAALTAL
jgi:hypothetical protein